MSGIDELKVEIRKLSARAMQLKMNLHDLSEELPTNWTTIPSVAQEAFEAFRQLDEKRRALAALATT
ncbi:MAG: CCE_0567 family metalloprotein [Magnetospirillum sp.]|nr:CCE_0567 family metalloprotein [Magnetospirillum sp.]